MQRSLLLATLALMLIGADALADEKHHPFPTAPAPAAQPAPKSATGMMGGGMHPGGMGMMMMHKADAAAALTTPRRIEGRIAYLRSEIAPTGPQEPGFAAVADALRAAERTTSGGVVRKYGAAGEGTTMVDRLAAEESATAARLKAIQALRAAFTALDATLTAEQRATAAELLPLLFPNLL